MDSDKRCETCKNFYACVPMLTDKQWGVCDIARSVGQYPVGNGEHVRAFAYGYGARNENGAGVNDLFVRSDFGCVQWEPRDG